MRAARGNNNDRRRTLLLGGHNRPLTLPDFWTDEVPEAIARRPPDALYEGTRIPGKYLV